MMNRVLLWLSLWLLSTPAWQLAAQCDPDTQAPVAVCYAGLVFEIAAGQTDTLFAHEVNAFSNDNCTPVSQLQLRLERAPFSSIPPDTEYLLIDESDAGALVVSLWVTDQAGNSQQCWTEIQVLTSACDNPDVLPVCVDQLSLALPTSGALTLSPDDVLDGNYNCPLLFTLQLDPPGTPMQQLLLGPDDIGDHIVQVTNVNTNVSCWANLSITGNCEDDPNALPVCVDQLTLALPPSGALTLSPDDVLESDYNCPQLFTLQLDPPGMPLQQLLLGPDDIGDHIVQVTNVNTNVSCWANLNITGNCEDDATAPVVVCDAAPSIALGENGTGVNILLAEQINEGSYDNCTAPENLQFALEFGPVISPTMPSSTQLEISTSGQYTIILWVADEAGNTDVCLTELTAFVPFCSDADPDAFQKLTGQVFQDNTENCSHDADEPGLAGWRVKALSPATGNLYYAITDELGRYEMRLICPGETILDIGLDVPFLYSGACATTWNVQLIPGSDNSQNIPVHLEQECALLATDIVAPFLRRCLPNTYTVSYCNYSNQTIEGVHIEVSLDEWMQLTGSEIPSQEIGNNTFFFPIGSLQPGECGNFDLFFDLSCDAIPGQTHCATARIFPYSLCPESPDWSGANIEVEGYCQNDSVYWIIKNTGPGNMIEPLEFIVVEDVIMYLRDQFQLGSGQTMNLPPIPSSGQTWRLEAHQAPAHPYSGSVAAVVEGCNGINTTGLVSVFPLENPDPFIANDCRENIGAIDPNDKSAAVLGMDEERYIRVGTDLEYLIRFQNTGTDTAFRVVILDTLSQWLRPESVRPGASSHPYSFELLEGGILRFSFEHILLPDSNVNEPASHGFVQFWVRQQTEIPAGARIENTAAIFFDQLAPVITNTVFHTIGENLIQAASSAQNGKDQWGELTVFPNPSAGDVDFQLPLSLTDKNVDFELYDVWGRFLMQTRFLAGKYRLRKGNLAPGMYFYLIKTEGKAAYSGKLIIR